MGEIKSCEREKQYGRNTNCQSKRGDWRQLRRNLFLNYGVDGKDTAAQSIQKSPAVRVILFKSVKLPSRMTAATPANAHIMPIIWKR